MSNPRSAVRSIQISDELAARLMRHEAAAFTEHGLSYAAERLIRRTLGLPELPPPSHRRTRRAGILQMGREGKTHREIAEALGTDPAHVARVLGDASVHTPSVRERRRIAERVRRERKNRLEENVVTLARRGLYSGPEIRAQVGARTTQHVYSILHRHGIRLSEERAESLSAAEADLHRRVMEEVTGTDDTLEAIAERMGLARQTLTRIAEDNGVDLHERRMRRERARLEGFDSAVRELAESGLYSIDEMAEALSSESHNVNDSLRRQGIELSVLKRNRRLAAPTELPALLRKTLAGMMRADAGTAARMLGISPEEACLVARGERPVTNERAAEYLHRLGFVFREKVQVIYPRLGS